MDEVKRGPLPLRFKGDCFLERVKELSVRRRSLDVAARTFNQKIFVRLADDIFGISRATYLRGVEVFRYQRFGDDVTAINFKCKSDKRKTN